MKKHLTAAALSFILLLGLFCTPALAAGSTQVFTDVASGDWYYEDVMALYNAGVVNGFGDGSFKPGSTVTTGQALKMVLLAAGYDEPAPVASHWARGYLNLALSEGILVRGEITDLDVSITRALVAKVAALALGVQKTSDSFHFTDTQDEYIEALYEYGILNGYADGTFRPDRSLTRAELSAIVYRIDQYVQSREIPDNDLNNIKPSDIKLRTTEDGLSFIKSMEGYVEKAYRDYSQYSIGYGSSCTKDEYPDGITKEQADILLREKVQALEVTLDAFLTKYGISVTDSQYDALASFTYNVGSTWMNSGYRLAKLLISGNYSDNELACAMGIWCHVTTNGTTVINNSLIARRIREVQIFLYGDYSGDESQSYHYLIYKTEQGSVEVDVALYREGSYYDPLYSASCSDCNFMGWFTDAGEEITENSRVQENLTVTAAWETPAEPEPVPGE